MHKKQQQKPAKGDTEIQTERKIRLSPTHSLTHSPLPSLELVADILQEPVQLYGVLPEDIAAKASQSLEPIGDVGVPILQPLLLGIAQCLNNTI